MMERTKAGDKDHVGPRTGLTAGTLYYFRVQSVTKDGLGNWSQIVSLMAK
jgi:hypothetical protein